MTCGTNEQSGRHRNVDVSRFVFINADVAAVVTANMFTSA
jgi:hypothetical protein